MYIRQRAQGEIYQATCGRGELAQSHTTLGEDARCLGVDQVFLVIDNLTDADLGNLDTAGQTRARVAVENSVLADAVPPGFEKGVLLGVQAETCGEVGTALGSTVASRA